MRVKMNQSIERNGEDREGKIKSKKKILFVGSEVMPFAATGGLGDVLSSLPQAIARAGGGDVRVVMPLHAAVSEDFRKEMKDEYEKTVCLSWRRQPCHVKSLWREGVTYYFIGNEYYFDRPSLYGYIDDGERYAFFSMAVLDLMREIGFYPDVLHLNDWQTAPSVVYLEAFFRENPLYRGIRTVFTIHNILYQGEFDHALFGDVFGLPEGLREVVDYGGRINLLKAAIELSDRVTTVSPRYAEEICKEQYGAGLHYVLRQNSDKLSGILNGIDYDYYDPMSDGSLPIHYSADDVTGKALCKTAFFRKNGLTLGENAPLAAIISRLVPHKGIDLITQIAYYLVGSTELRLAVLGRGEKRYEDFFRGLESAYPDRVRVFIDYDRDLAKEIYAATDLFLMPSESEPCGLAQMIASRYGAVPVTRETGGLYDSIKCYYERDGRAMGNGFTFSEYDSRALEASVRTALSLYERKEKWARLVENVMRTDFSFRVSAEEYLKLYEEL